MLNRRRFIKNTTAGLVSFFGLRESVSAGGKKKFKPPGKTMFISTWKHGIPANEVAAGTIRNGGSLLDAVENAVMVAEADPNVTSVGYGGNPNEDGIVELDASIMWGPEHKAGAVAGLQNIMHPISVARLVMERTKHVMLVGEGALNFAVEHGFEEENLTDASRERWLKWRENSSESDTRISPDNHDTIGLIGMDEEGNMAGACTTSGVSYKVPGRVGDSPIIGAGMYVDNEIGGAAATGWGEEMIKIAGSFLVVENMRRGMSPDDACKAALERMIEKNEKIIDFSNAFVALRKDGKTGAAAIGDGFQYALYNDGKNDLYDVENML